jgi:hypothetical protein
MHYRNGREAKNGDTIVKLGGNRKDGATPYIVAFGELQNAMMWRRFSQRRASINGRKENSPSVPRSNRLRRRR